MRVGTHTLVAKNPRLSQGVFALFWLVSGCLAAVAAARIALAHADGGHETSRFLQFLALGYSIDLQFVFPVLAFATVGGVTARQGLWLAGFPRHSVWVRLLPELTLLMACILLWALSITVTEFRIQRGVFPTFFDFQNGLESNFITSSLPTFFLKRYQTGNTLFLLWLVAFGLSVGLRMRQSALSSASETALGNRLLWIALGTFVAHQVGFRLYNASETIFPAVLRRAQHNAAWQTLLESPQSTFSNSRFGMRTLFRSIETTPQSVAEGARALGLRYKPAASNGAAPCRVNPLAVAFEVPRAASLSSPSASSPPRSLQDELRAVSQLVFSVPQPDLQVWQLLLESFRSNDVQALEPAAPKSITPFMNDLYQNRERYPWVLTASHLHQAGVRTSQALSAMLCGLGSTPFSLSVSRDFGKLSLRCLQEVLGDGGFKPTAFFGSDMAFDRMSLFFGSRGVETVEERQMPKGLPRGGWGLSDRAVFQSALAQQAHAQHPTFNFVFSVSNHSPYTAPEDLPAEVKSRVAALKTDSFGQPVSPDDLSRLTTLSYTDFAASEFVTVLEERRKRAIVVLAPDHNTPETFLWGTKNPSPSEASKLSVLPLAIVFSEALVASLAPETQQQLRAALAHVNQRLQSDILSQNDLPRLVLALLSAAPSMRNMPEGRRWHTLGGQTTSPEFRAPFNPKALVWGLAADTRLFTVTESGATSFHGHSQNPPTSLGDLAQLDKEPLAPEARLLAAFLRDYDEPCGGTTDENAQEELGP